MSNVALQRLIGTALTDSSFRAALLNGSRRKILSRFPFSSDEVEAIMAIQANTLDEFARAAHLHFVARVDELEPLPPLRGHAVFRETTYGGNL